MEYIFGRDKTETLKTKGSEHTDLTGFQEVVREYPDCTITDSFRVVKKYKSSEDAEGNCYDWYTIEDHYRMIDRTKPIKEDLDSVIISVLEGSV